MTTTSQQAATRAAIVAAVKAFVERVNSRAFDLYMAGGADHLTDIHWQAIAAELAALERTVAADGAEHPGARSAVEQADLQDGRY